MEPQRTLERVSDVRIADRARVVAALLGALTVVTVVAVDPGGLIPTGPLRWTATTVLAAAAVLATVLHGVRVDRRVGAIWLALIAWLLFASMAAVDSLHAWIGTPDRRLGFLAWCSFPLLFAAGCTLVDRGDRRTVMRGFTIGAAILGVWSISERLGWSVLDQSFAHHRVGGPFGQPSYLGAAALLFGACAFGVACDGGEARMWRVLGAFGGAGCAAALVLSGTRAAWVGAVVVVIALGVARRRYRELAVVGVVLVLLAIATPIRARITDDVGRSDEWRVAVRVVEHHPVIGVGPEGYRTVFGEYVDARYVARHGSSFIPDRAHNGLLDVAAIGGVVAALLYVALLVLVLVAAWRALSSADPLAVASGAAVIGYVVQQQFLFPLQELDPLFWVLAGFLFATTRRDEIVLARGRLVAATAIGVGLVFALVMGTREVIADRLLQHAADGRGNQRLADADHATRLRSDSIRTWYAAARIAARGDALTDVDAALVRAEQGLRRSPRDPALRRLQAALLAERAARSELASDRDDAVRIITEYLAQSPHDQVLRAALTEAEKS